jgi:molybdenum-dependent DNA-binding transcriptional regulator ModE
MNDRLEPQIRILLGSSIAIGPGKAALLEAISETGSIAAAGRRCSKRSAKPAPLLPPGVEWE